MQDYLLSCKSLETVDWNYDDRSLVITRNQLLVSDAGFNVFFLQTESGEMFLQEHLYNIMEVSNRWDESWWDKWSRVCERERMTF